MAIIVKQECGEALTFFSSQHSLTFTEEERPVLIDIDGIFHMAINWEAADVPLVKGVLCRRNRYNDLVVDARIVPDRWSNTPDGLKLWFHFEFK